MNLASVIFMSTCSFQSYLSIFIKTHHNYICSFSNLKTTGEWFFYLSVQSPSTGKILILVMNNPILVYYSCNNSQKSRTKEKCGFYLQKTLKTFFFLIKAPRTHNITPGQKDQFPSWRRRAGGCYLLNSQSNVRWLAFSFCFSLNSRWSWFFSKAASHHPHSWSLT